MNDEEYKKTLNETYLCLWLLTVGAVITATLNIMNYVFGDMYGFTFVACVYAVLIILGYLMFNPLKRIKRFKEWIIKRK